MSKLFHETVGDWKRASLDENKAMGMNITEAVYEKNRARIEINLIGSGAGGGGKKIRIQRRTATEGQHDIQIQSVH